MDIESIKNTVIHGDCLDIMKQLPDKCIDLVLTDPPYGIGEAKGKNKSRGLLAVSKDYGCDDWDNEIPSKEYFDEMIRISKHCVIFGGNYFIEYLTNSPCWIVWNKDNGKTDFADCELAWTNFDTAVRKFDWKWQGMLQEDMGHKETRVHPTQKPIQLFRWILETYVERGTIILDPFAGSGTTGVACKELGYNYILIEKESKYIDIINKRLENITPSLF